MKRRYLLVFIAALFLAVCSFSMPSSGSQIVITDGLAVTSRALAPAQTATMLMSPLPRGLSGALHPNGDLALYVWLNSPGDYPSNVGYPVAGAAVSLVLQQGPDQNHLKKSNLNGTTDANGYIEWNLGKKTGMVQANILDIVKAGYTLQYATGISPHFVIFIPKK